jgi:hypothetical protein
MNLTTHPCSGWKVPPVAWIVSMLYVKPDITSYKIHSVTLAGFARNSIISFN